jgi:hypothetical protein
MATPSKIDKLPEAVKDLIHQLRTREGKTIDEILAKLRELEDVAPEALPGRSALGEYTKEIDAVAEQIKRSRGIADAVIARHGEATEDRNTRLNIELLHGLLTQLLVPVDGQVVISAKEGAQLASAIEKLARASRLDQDREITRLREMVAKVEKFADAVEERVSGAKGLTAEQAAQMRRDILGVRAPG